MSILTQKKCGIYCIENTVDGKKYVGQSVDLRARITDHKIRLNSGKHPNRHLQRAFNKYGGECFKFYILRECTLDEMDSWERIFIRHFDSIDNGYNQDGGGNFGKTRPESVKRAQSERMKGNKYGLGKGHPMSDEAKRKLSGLKKGKPVPKERLLKIQEAAKLRRGRKMSEEQKQKISKGNKGKRLGLKVVFSEEHRRNLSIAGRGKKMSDEAKRKIAEAKRVFWAKKRMERENG